MNTRKHLLMNQIAENSGGGGGTSAQVPTTPAIPKAEGGSDSAILNEMYKDAPTKEAAAPEKQPTQEAVPAKAAEPSATGYGQPDPTKEAVPPKTEVATPATETKVEFNAEGLNDDGKKIVTEFAKTHALTKEATQAFADQLKTQLKVIGDAQIKRETEAADKEKIMRSQWSTELKTDKDFGGEHFDANLKRVDTLMEKYFPHTKNLLTTTKGMLPPSIMKDLHSVYEVLLGNKSTMANAEAGAKTNMEGAQFLEDYYK
jgi:hypothetical protein